MKHLATRCLAILAMAAVMAATSLADEPLTAVWRERRQGVPGRAGLEHRRSGYA